MTNLWTHILFSEEIMDAVKKPMTNTKVDAFIKLGAIGPDLFYYYNLWPWSKANNIYELGEVMHAEPYNEFLMDLIISAKNQSSEVKAFIIGFISHYLLDNKTQPFIQYWSEYEANSPEQIERGIDMQLMKKYHHVDVWNIPVYKEVYVGRSLNKGLVKLLHEKIDNYYPEIKAASPAYLQKTYRNMLFALKFSTDFYKWKTFFMKPLPKTLKQRSDEATDYLNSEHKSWCHPKTNQYFKKSFNELYNEARINGIEILTELRKYWYRKDELSKQRLAHLIDKCHLA